MAEWLSHQILVFKRDAVTNPHPPHRHTSIQSVMSFYISILINHNFTRSSIPGHVVVGGSASIKLFTFTDISGFLLILLIFHQLNFTQPLFNFSTKIPMSCCAAGCQNHKSNVVNGVEGDQFV